MWVLGREPGMGPACWPQDGGVEVRGEEHPLPGDSKLGLKKVPSLTCRQWNGRCGEWQGKICILESPPGAATVLGTGHQQVGEKGEAGVCALGEPDTLAHTAWRTQPGTEGASGRRTTTEGCWAVLRGAGRSTPLCREGCCHSLAFPPSNSVRQKQSNSHALAGP